MTRKGVQRSVKWVLYGDVRDVKRLDAAAPDWPGEDAARAREPSARRRRPPIRAFVDLALQEEFDRTTSLALDYFAATGSRIAVMADLLDGAKTLIEDRWHVGNATTRDEYRVFQAIELAMEAVPEPRVERVHEPKPRAVLLTLWPEEHDLGLRLVAAALHDEGWDVTTALRVMPQSIAATVTHQRFQLVGMSATYVAGATRAELAEIGTELHRARVPVLAGGSAFMRYPALAQYFGADALGDDARQAALLAARLVGLDQRRSTPRRRAS